MNIDLLLALIFFGFLLVIFFSYRSKFEVQGKIFVMCKTKLGLKLMDRIAKTFPRTLRFLGIISIITGFVGMAFIFYFLIKGTVDLLFVAGAPPAVAPVLPGIKVMPGIPVMSFFHWIIGIFIVAVIHEFSHGIYARLHNIKIKSSGFAFLGPILAAFVEPDEKIMAKKSKKVQLSVFSAGPFSNILTGLVFLLALNFITLPLFSAAYDGDGITVNTLVDGYPMQESGAEAPFVILGINDHEVLDFEQFADATENINPDQMITIKTDKGDVEVTTVENPDDNTRGFIGIKDFELIRKPNEGVVAKFGAYMPPVIQWVHMLVFWLWVISLGIGLFNLLPLGPVDGGRMFLTGLLAITKNEEKAKKYWSFVSFVCLLLIFINLAPYLWQLVLFLFKPLIMLFSFA